MQFMQLVEKLSRGKISNTLACSGTMMRSALRSTSLSRQPCSPAGVSSTALRTSRGGLPSQSGLASHNSIGRATWGRRDSHHPADCCPSMSPRATEWPRLA